MGLIDADKLRENLIGCGLDRLADDIVDREISYMTPANAIPIPENATKGDAMELVFPELEFKPGEDGISTSFMKMNNNTGFASLYKEWWNSPYQLSLEKEIKDILGERD